MTVGNDLVDGGNHGGNVVGGTRLSLKVVDPVSGWVGGEGEGEGGFTSDESSHVSHTCLMIFAFFSTSNPPVYTSTTHIGSDC